MLLTVKGGDINNYSGKTAINLGLSQAKQYNMVTLLLAHPSLVIFSYKKGFELLCVNYKSLALANDM